MDTQAVDFLIVTPLEEEMEALLRKLPNSKKLPPEEEHIRVYYEASMPVSLLGGRKGAYRIIIASPVSMGRLDSATLTTDAINRWRPRYVLVVGIAGGVLKNGVNLGDILIGDQIFDYETQKLTMDGPEIRPKTYNADPRLLTAAKNLRGGTRWQKTTARRPRGGAPKRHIGPIASGDKVLEDGAALARLSELTPKLLGVEMEAAGVCLAASQTVQAPRVLTIRGVSDPANELKSSLSVSRWRPYARELAAAFAVYFLKSGPIPFVSWSRTSILTGGGSLPKADPKRFSVALLHLLHDVDQNVERMIIEGLRDLEGIQVLSCDRTISPEGPIPGESEAAGHETARLLLNEADAQVSIWGTVLSHEGRSAPRLFWTTSTSSMRSRQPYIPESFQLPQLFWEDIVQVIRLLVLTQSAELLGRRGQYIAAQLGPFVEKVCNLIEGSKENKGWTRAARAQVTLIYAACLTILGGQTHEAHFLSEAIKYSRQVLADLTIITSPFDWGAAQNNLGTALGSLGL